MRVDTAFFLALWLAVAQLAAQGVGDLPPTGTLRGPQAHALMKELGDGLVVLDVRTPKEYAKKHIPGAINIPVDELANRAGELPNERPILIVCRAGVRAAAAYSILLKTRPGMASSGLWRLDARPAYKRDGTIIFK